MKTTISEKMFENFDLYLTGKFRREYEGNEVAYKVYVRLKDKLFCLIEKSRTKGFLSIEKDFWKLAKTARRFFNN